LDSHGALGSFVRVHVFAGDATEMAAYCRTLAEVERVLLKEDAACEFEMPADREGDFVVVSRRNAVVGARAAEHDLSNVSDHRLRSHGGLSEQHVPLLMSTPVKGDERIRDGEWRNFDIFDLILNYGQ
jgi:phosphonoacetate hydrolase